MPERQPYEDTALTDLDSSDTIDARLSPPGAWLAAAAWLVAGAWLDAGTWLDAGA